MYICYITRTKLLELHYLPSLIRLWNEPDPALLEIQIYIYIYTNLAIFAADAWTRFLTRLSCVGGGGGVKRSGSVTLAGEGVRPRSGSALWGRRDEEGPHPPWFIDRVTPLAAALTNSLSYLPFSLLFLIFSFFIFSSILSLVFFFFFYFSHCISRIAKFDKLFGKKLG